MSSSAEAIAAAELYVDARNYSRARQVLSTALAENPDDPALLTEYARVGVYSKDFQSAAASAYAALARQPNDELTMRLYALALDGLGRHGEALWMAWRNVTDNPQVHLAHHVYARMLSDAGRSSDAIVVINEALRLEPTYSDSRVLRASILRKLGRFDESDADYHDVLSVDPDHAVAAHNLAVNRLDTGKLASATRGLLGAARLDPELGDLARDNAGLALIKGLRRASVLLLMQVIFLIQMDDALDDGRPILLHQVFIGACTAALVACLVWALRLLPWRTLRSVVRARPAIVFRVAVMVFGIVVGLVAAGFGPSAGVTAATSVLLLTVLALGLLTLLTRQ
jgi:Flp pilus assembly protein TadD